MNFYIYLINRIRRLFRSLSKYEKKINQYLIYLKWKNINKDFKIVNINLAEFESLGIKLKLPKKIAICICFYFKDEKIELLKKTCSTLNDLGQQVDVTIITNENNQEKIDNLKIQLNKNINNLNFFIPKDLQNSRLLPWSHYLVMKKKILDESYSHFIYLEDDIKITKENIIYWIKAREVLKEKKLIPGFIRTEINDWDKNIYATDYLEKNNLKRLPKILLENSKFAFTNTLYPYQGMYLYDRELMIEHLNGPSSNPDFGHGEFDINSMNINLIKLSILAKANSGLTFKDIPKGFFNRYVIPIDLDKKKIKDYSLIQHHSNEYANKESLFGKINIKDLFF